MIETDSIIRTRETLREHRSLPLPRRVLKRLIGSYPDRDARKELRRFELGPDGRIVEDTISSVYYSRRTNSTPAAILDRPWITASLDAMAYNASLPVELGPEDDDLREAIAALIAEKDLVVNEFSEVGVFLPEYDRFTQQDHVDKVGIMVMSDYNPQGAVVYTREEIRDLSQDNRETFESLASMAEGHAFMTYARNKPESLP